MLSEGTITRKQRSKIEDKGCDSSVEKRQKKNNTDISVTLSGPEVLDCTICFEPLCSPVFQCKNGHIACSPCRFKASNKCHTTGAIRCLAIEKVLESIKFSCSFSQYGCTETISYCDRTHHEKTCIYAPCFCPVLNCDFHGSSKQLSRHFNCTHFSLFRSFRYNFKFTVCFNKNESLLVFKEERGGSLFFLNNRKEPIGNSLAVTAINTTASKCGFLYELKTSSGSSSLTFQSYTKCIKSLQDASCTEFLVVPCDFSRSGQLKVEVCIKISK